MRENELVRFIYLPKITDDGSLVFAQTPDHIPFPINRIYSIFDADPKFPRGFHAHKKTQQVLFCLNSDIKIIVDDGKKRATVFLDKPEHGLFLDKMVWHEMHDFKKKTILLVLASNLYDPDDYIRDYKEFLGLSKASG
ncbi:FdtA/QdtA family cupin domain-containing protein [Candidatus Daviesbacteria bacterium]|nr:FdtA/QdtA family cupin domain-containing protein [Candidatus Daviesbacteria bacterium]